MGRCQHAVDAAIYSTVGPGGETAMRFLCDFAPQVLSIKDPGIRLPVSIPSAFAGSLGADRIAAAVGAYRIAPGRPMLVVDAGTAVTYDVVSREGVFVGGNIAPGLRLGLDALHRHTALLPDIQPPYSIDASLLGYDTESAMIHGVVYGIIGAIESMCRRLGGDTKVVLTGGVAPMLTPLLQVEAEYAPHLVLDGLAHIAATRFA